MTRLVFFISVLITLFALSESERPLAQSLSQGEKEVIVVTVEGEIGAGLVSGDDYYARENPKTTNQKLVALGVLPYSQENLYYIHATGNFRPGCCDEGSSESGIEKQEKAQKAPKAQISK